MDRCGLYDGGQSCAGSAARHASVPCVAACTYLLHAQAGSATRKESMCASCILSGAGRACQRSTDDEERIRMYDTAVPRFIRMISTSVAFAAAVRDSVG